ncbi:MAG: DUF4147 domain-containing protein [Pirellulales bacterium]|nr:DUF4147 domain-containing protein [Pirellulales bacterium]
MENSTQARDDARQIWLSGVDAVRADRLVHKALRCEANILSLGGQTCDLSDVNQIAVVGAGKGGASMAAAIEDVLGPDLVKNKVVGWVNIPADCVRPLQKIHLHAARPASVNEPTEEGVAGTDEILKILSSLAPTDLCLVLISGGGSALLPAPQSPITLADLLAVTRLLMRSGASINELNSVRKCLSRIKGGKLAQASRAGTLWSMIVSDVIDNPLDIIASGPTVPDHTSRRYAKEILERFDKNRDAVPKVVYEYLENDDRPESPPPFPENVYNVIIGDNQTALAAATVAAKQLGYQVLSLGSDNDQQAVLEGQHLAECCLKIRGQKNRAAPGTCILSGGEPVVELTDCPGKGGRNQHLVLSALDRLWADGMQKITLLSGGTDGEDGPTDAAGAWADAGILEAARQQGLQPEDCLRQCNAYAFFDPLGALIRTGPTHTNVMDLRVAIIEP